MKKLIIGFILIMVVFYAHQYITRPVKGETKDVRPYVENCLNLIINKDFNKIYELYCKGTELSVDEFNNQIKCLSLIFGEPLSYEYFRSYIGGVGYFIQYHLFFSNNKKYTCFFEFPITEGKKIIEKIDLQRLSISGDFGERSFVIFFDNGRIYGHKSPNIDCGYDYKNDGSITSQPKGQPGQSASEQPEGSNNNQL